MGGDVVAPLGCEPPEQHVLTKVSSPQHGPVEPSLPTHIIAAPVVWAPLSELPPLPCSFHLPSGSKLLSSQSVGLEREGRHWEPGLGGEAALSSWMEERHGVSKQSCSWPWSQL